MALDGKVQSLLWIQQIETPIRARITKALGHLNRFLDRMDCHTLGLCYSTKQVGMETSESNVLLLVVNSTDPSRLIIP